MSVDKLASGKWRARWRDFDPITGVTTMKQKTFRTQREAKQYDAEITTQKRNGTYQKDLKLTLEEWVNTWLADYAPQNCKPSTLKDYEIWLKYITDSLGTVKLTDVTALQLQKIFNTLNDKPGMQQNTRIALHSCLSNAVKLGLLVVNPLDRVSFPKRKRLAHEMPSDEDLQRLVSSWKGDRFENVYDIILMSGLRISEALGLSFADVDYNKHTLNVDKQLFHKNGEFYFIPTKTSTPRTINIPDTAIELLRKLQKYQMECAQLDYYENYRNLFFTDGMGRPLHYRTVSDHFEKIRQRAGLENFTIHSLRHCYASVLLAGGIDIKSVQTLLGHASARTTLDIYTHALESSKASAAATIGETFAKLKKSV